MDLSLVNRIPIRTRCSKNDYRSGKKDSNGKGDELSVDWDKAWSSYRKQKKKPFFSQFNSDKYVSWNPRRGGGEYPFSEEFDPIKRTERSNLTPWTSPNFTLVGAIIVVSLLLIYTLMAPLK
ncbi:LOW QUALITY PROTEIN: uncharacterized protein LOC110032052 [Phalaenopsis equestris]|uniref:LOW QUALITY PROTEIN: uncharacterized protein LOC110032052 n=1 Tax=Phalaenopsis equestris TaxID=78828 RepID=UPI0009E2FD08|nr:LOW QUALITY PROTEIN: uncharacterized protein LOC110032052 [Phalaenopsis equestris]